MSVRDMASRIRSPRKRPMDSDAGSTTPLLRIRDLVVEFRLRHGAVITAVDGVSFDVRQGEILGLVGESGSGKSVTALSIGGLIQKPGRVKAGSIQLRAVDLRSVNERELKNWRGNEVGFIFQDPMSSLNPVMTIGAQIAEVVKAHTEQKRDQTKRRVLELLTQVGIPAPARRYHDYPHQFSGGMRQRVMIAMALAGEPSLIIADEPTTSLDVTVQAQILRLIRDLVDERGLGVLLITHDFGVAGAVCDRIAVMYAGQLVEVGGHREILEHPSAPYTAALIKAIPRTGGGSVDALTTIPGAPPQLWRDLSGCRFAPRCAYAKEVCRREAPLLIRREAKDHSARCWGTEGGGWIESP